MRAWAGLGAVLAAFCLALPEAAPGQEYGVDQDRVLFGQSAAFEGPAGDLGTSFRAGILAAFGEANARDGVYGRKLELLSLDDRYEPELTVVNTRTLIEDEQVFALIGGVGTPTSRAAAPITAEKAVPFIAPYTGAEFLRDAGFGNVVNLRASYFQETDTLVGHLIDDLGTRRIAVLHQSDSYGLAGLAGVELALEDRDLEPVGISTYARNSIAVKTAVLELRASDAGAVILIGAYKPVAAAIAWSRHIGFDPVFATISFSGGNSLAAELRDLGQGGVYVSQVVPFPNGEEQIARRYRRALAAHASGAKPDFVSFEGYLAGCMAVVGLERAGSGAGRSRFLDGILKADPIYLGEFTLRFRLGENQGSDRVYLTLIGPDGTYSPIESMSPAQLQ